MAQYKIGTISTETKQVSKKQSISKNQKTINYTELRTLQCKYENNTAKKKNDLLPGLRPNSKSFIFKPTSQKKQQPQQRQEPRLLTTAVSMIKRKYEEHQNLQKEHGSNNNLSNYFSSRELTPINPLGSSLHNHAHLSKKRIRTHQTNKSRLQSITSDHHQQESQAESVGQILPPYKQKDFRIYDRVLGQSQAAYHYAFGRERKIPQKLIYLWKECLLHEDKTEIFVPVNPEQTSSIPYTHPKIFPLNELEKGFEEVYGTGKQRCLKVGEEALIIEGIAKYLQKCTEEPMKIARKDYDIISDILADCKITELENYPMCYRQIQGHFKIMATKWKYDNIENKSNRMFESAIINGKNHFVDLGKHSVLAEYLLKNSNKNQFI